MTGSGGRSAPQTHTAAASLALSRLRVYVLACCWCVGLALLTQFVIWGMVSFTEIRWNTDQPAEVAAESLVVRAERAPSRRSALDPTDPADVAVVPPPAIETRLSGTDRVFYELSRLASGFGSLAMIVMVPLIALGVIVGAASGTRGIHSTVSAVSWALVVSVFILPVGDVFGLPWSDGAFWSYERLTGRIDAAAAAAEAARQGGEMTELFRPGSAVFFARYLVLPMLCLTGLFLIGVQFSSGLAAGLMRRENFALDPALEQEVANIKVGSLHGGRSGAAMQHTITGSPGMGSPLPAATPPPPTPAVATHAAPAAPGGAGIPGQSLGVNTGADIRQASQGEAPRRLI